MGRAIIAGFKTKVEAEVYLQCMNDFKILDIHDRFVLDDRDYNGEFTVNID